MFESFECYFSPKVLFSCNKYAYLFKRGNARLVLENIHIFSCSLQRSVWYIAKMSMLLPFLLLLLFIMRYLFALVLFLLNIYFCLSFFRLSHLSQTMFYYTSQHCWQIEFLANGLMLQTNAFRQTVQCGCICCIRLQWMQSFVCNIRPNLPGGNWHSTRTRLKQLRGEAFSLLPPTVITKATKTISVRSRRGVTHGNRYSHYEAESIMYYWFHFSCVEHCAADCHI